MILSWSATELYISNVSTIKCSNGNSYTNPGACLGTQQFFGHCDRPWSCYWCFIENNTFINFNIKHSIYYILFRDNQFNKIFRMKTLLHFTDIFYSFLIQLLTQLVNILIFVRRTPLYINIYASE